MGANPVLCPGAVGLLSWYKGVEVSFVNVSAIEDGLEEARFVGHGGVVKGGCSPSVQLSLLYIPLKQLPSMVVTSSPLISSGGGLEKFGP